MTAPLDSTDALPSTEPGIDLWRVQLATGEVRAMSLDALDDAFQAGTINEATPVLPPGATAWTKLSDAAGLEAQDAGANVPSVAPLAVSVGDATGDATPYSREPGGAPRLDVDVEPAAFKASKGRVFAGLGLAALVVAGLGFAATRVGGMATSASNALSSQATDPHRAAAAQPPPAADDVNAFGTSGRVLTEEQKAKLAEADRAREAKQPTKKGDRPTTAPRRAPGDKGAPFSNGGDKYDPLNGAL